MRKLKLFALLTIAAAGSAYAQASIDPGMTKEQVIARLGKPASEHSSGSATFLYYRNGQEKKMGMSDMVALDSGKVVDAVFRSSARRYTGRSSSPAPVSAEAAIAKGNGGRAPVKKAAPPVKKPATAAKPPAPAKAAPPAKRLSEPKKSVDTKKIQASPKAPDTTKKAAPAPAKKP